MGVHPNEVPISRTVLDSLILDSLILELHQAANTLSNWVEDNPSELGASPSTPAGAEAEEGRLRVHRVGPKLPELDDPLWPVWWWIRETWKRLQTWEAGPPAPPTTEKSTKTSPLDARDTGSINRTIRQSLQSAPPTMKIYHAEPGCGCVQFGQMEAELSLDGATLHIRCLECGALWLHVVIAVQDAPMSAME
jgi:hypothetical protein